MSEAATHEVQYGDSTIEYHLSYSPRTTLAIHVHPDLRVTVQAPPDTALEVIAEKVRQRGDWIMRQQRTLEQYLPHLPPHRYISGETLRYLGRQYRLKVLEAEEERVKLVAGWLRVYTPDSARAEQVEALVQGWYRQQAQRVFPERLAALQPRFAQLALPPVHLKIRRMKTRWGSCSTSGTVTLNLKLMQVPKRCIDYVIVHELCHLLEHNHSPAFYHLLDRTMPDWRERREELNRCEVR